MIPNIQGLRALAALMVLAHHVLPEAEWAQFGVDIFFPISGFVMVLTTYKSRGRDGSAVQFAIRRIIRIVPIYWAATIVYFLTRPDLHYPVSALVTSLMFLPTDADPSPDGFYPIIDAGWTLNIEMLFYLVLTGALLLRSKLVYPATIAVIFVLVICGLVLGPTAPMLTFYVMSPLMLEFVLGVAAGLLYMHGVRLHSWWVLCSLGLLGVVLLQPGDAIARALMIGLPCAAMVALLGMGKQPSGSAAGLLVICGDVSYALYVVHIPVIIMMRHFGFSEWAMAATAIVVAFSVRFGFELPVTKFLRERFLAGSQRETLKQSAA